MILIWKKTVKYRAICNLPHTEDGGTELWVDINQSKLQYMKKQCLSTTSETYTKCLIHIYHNWIAYYID